MKHFSESEKRRFFHIFDPIKVSRLLLKLDYGHLCMELEGHLKLRLQSLKSCRLRLRNVTKHPRVESLVSKRKRERAGLIIRRLLNLIYVWYVWSLRTNQWRARTFKRIFPFSVFPKFSLRFWNFCNLCELVNGF